MRVGFRFREWLLIVVVVACACSAKQVQTSGDEKLSFALPDMLGREIRSQDYAGMPVLIMAGSCWCGGCQQDADPLREIAEEYGAKGLAVIRSVSGDNDLAAIDFAKHYRLGFPQILDTNRKFEKKYNPDGWTFLMLADAQGRIAYKANSPVDDDWPKIKRLLDDMLREKPSVKSQVVEGIQYSIATLERTGKTQNAIQRDLFPSIACGQDGKVYVVFTTNRKGSSDIFFSVYDGNNFSDEKPLAATEADEYDGTVVVDADGNAWFAWTSNVEAGKYNIFVTSIQESNQPAEPKRVSIGVDDSMHGRLASDSNNNIWVTFYKWQNMSGMSRDKEIFVRRLSNGQWSKQLQVSPADVPDYEDHSEPAIAGLGDGVIVCWSWDFHQPANYTKQAELPTIFARKVDKDFRMNRATAVSAKDIDVTPAVGIINGQTWCAWDSMQNSYLRRLCMSKAMSPGKIHYLTEPLINVCTPSIAVGKDGKACVVWSQTEDGKKWILAKAEYDPGSNTWTQADIVESQGNPRFCSACFDNKGKLWVAYSVQKEGKRQIAVKQL